jgi:hypothetical protein
MSETLAYQFELLVDQLFQEKILAGLKNSYYHQFQKLIEQLKKTQADPKTFFLDNVPHPVIYKFLVGNKIYYFDEKGRIYEPDKNVPNTARLVGGFRDNAFEIAGVVHTLNSRNVKLIPNRHDRLFVDEARRVYNVALNINSTVIGSAIGYIDSMHNVRLT